MEKLTDTEQRILQAATEVFLEKGKEGARMQEIARKAGINKALLHYYFRSKEQLYQRVFNYEVRSFFAALLQSVPQTRDLAQFLKGFIDGYLDQLAARPRMVRFISWEISQDMTAFKTILKEILLETSDSPLHHWITILEEAIEKEIIRPLNIHHFLFNLLGMCVYPFLAQPVIETLFPTIRVNSSEFLQERKKEIFELVWRGITKT